MLEGGGKKTSFDATLDVSNTPDVTTVKFTAEPFPFFDNGVSYFANYYAVKGGFASDEQISISGNSPELGDVGYPIYAEVAEWAENSYIGKCFLDCQFTGARSKHITDFKRTAAVGSAETRMLHVSYAEDSFTGYTAELSVDTAKSAVTQIVIRTANYTPDDDARVTGFPSPPRRKKKDFTHCVKSFFYLFSVCEVLFAFAFRHERAARRPDDVRGILPVRAKAAAFEIIRHLGQLHRTGKARAGGRLDKKSLRLVQGVKVCEQMLVRHREAAADHLLDRLPTKPEGAADGESVRRGAARQADILHADRILQAAGKAQQHARRFHRLSEVDVCRVAELLLQTKADTARRAADAAGNVNEQRVLVVHRDVLLGELRLEPPRSHSVAQEEVDRVFIVDKIASRVLRRALAALLHGVGVVRAVFEHRYALCAQQILFSTAARPRSCGP